MQEAKEDLELEESRGGCDPESCETGNPLEDLDPVHGLHGEIMGPNGNHQPSCDDSGDKGLVKGWVLADGTGERESGPSWF